MTKSELKTGMIVTVESGDKYVVLRDIEVSIGYHNVLVHINKRNDWCDLENFNEDMTNKILSCFNIIEVANVQHPCDILKLCRGCNVDTKLIWKRKEKKQYTYAQLREILGEEFEVVG